MAHESVRVPTGPTGGRGFIDPRLLDPAIEAGAGGVGRAAGAADLDLSELAAQKTGLLQRLAAPGQEREREALEARLLAQGRLGGTAGDVSQQLQREEFDAFGLQATLAGLGLAERERGAQFGMGLDLAQLGIGTSGREVGFGFEERASTLAERRFEFEKEKEEAARSQGGFLGTLFKSVAPAIGTAIGGPVGGFLGKSVAGLFAK